MKIEEVFGRQGCITEEGMLIRKRIIGAMINVNGDIAKAKANLNLSNPREKEYADGTLQSYWSEYQKLSEPEKKRFNRTAAADLAKAVNIFVEMPIT